MTIRFIQAQVYEVQGKLFTDWVEARKYDRKVNRAKLISDIRNLEGMQRVDKKEAARCIWRDEESIRRQAQMQRKVQRQSVELREMYKKLAEIS
jgi:hypothetical protein